jgi:hypothetical protein
MSTVGIEKPSEAVVRRRSAICLLQFGGVAGVVLIECRANFPDGEPTGHNAVGVTSTPTTE